MFNEVLEYMCVKWNKVLREVVYVVRMGLLWMLGCYLKLGEEGCTKILDVGARLAVLSDYVYVICMKCDKIVFLL